MKVRVQLFAMARMLAGADVLEVEIPPEATVADLRQAMIAAQPSLESIAGRSLFAINEVYAGDEDIIPANADVACLPPVSGG